MSADADPPAKLSLRRWSQRKLAASRAAAAKEDSPSVAAPPVPPAAPPPAAEGAAPALAGAPASALPPVESLTPESDFAAFMQPTVDEALKRGALRRLFSDPRFNVMDGLDVYVDDYTQAAPVRENLLARLMPIHAVLDAPAAPEAAGEAAAASVPPAIADAPPPAGSVATAPAAEPEPADPGAASRDRPA